MGITERQREDRNKYVGSSDVPALLGVSPWATAYDVWARKCDIVPPTEPTPAMLAGQFLEEAGLEFARQSIGPLRANQFRVRKGTKLGAHIDAIFVTAAEPLEIKAIGPHGMDGWGDPGTDEVPDHVTAQCHAHMLAMDVEQPRRCVVVAICGLDFRTYYVPWNSALAGVIVDRVAEFWKSVEAREAPTNWTPSLGVLKRLRREPASVVSVPPNVVVNWQETRRNRLEAEKAEEAAQSALLAAMLDAEAADGGSAGIVTYMLQTSRRLDSKKLAEELPEVANKYMVDSTYRVLRHKKAR